MSQRTRGLARAKRDTKPVLFRYGKTLGGGTNIKGSICAPEQRTFVRRAQDSKGLKCEYLEHFKAGARRREAGMKSKLLCFSSDAKGKRRCRGFARQALGGRQIFQPKNIRDESIEASLRLGESEARYEARTVPVRKDSWQGRHKNEIVRDLYGCSGRTIKSTDDVVIGAFYFNKASPISLDISVSALR